MLKLLRSTAVLSPAWPQEKARCCRFSIWNLVLSYMVSCAAFSKIRRMHAKRCRTRLLSCGVRHRRIALIAAKWCRGWFSLRVMWRLTGCARALDGACFTRPCKSNRRSRLVRSLARSIKRNIWFVISPNFPLRNDRRWNSLFSPAVPRRKSPRSCRRLWVM